jgi:hypothetical protein
MIGTGIGGLESYRTSRLLHLSHFFPRGCFPSISWVGTSSMTNAYVDAYVSFLADSIGLVSADGGNFHPMWQSFCWLCNFGATDLWLLYDWFMTGLRLVYELRLVLGPIFKKWQHLTSLMPPVFIQDKCLLHLNFLL